ncbi:hypothetical protein [Gramella sp. Hel_I_59]|uniref:hypothetical protein n=1 Tax=Gramella sp. Hel_I_59 TaxID=1249978 RepID=UPI00115442AB|nr:hypothetical protein [Gramella sp. Hel_I_59]
MNKIFKLFLLLNLIISYSNKTISQNIVEEYEQRKNDSIRIGIGEKDFLPFIQSGYTLMLPTSKDIKGVLVFLEDSGYDKKNKNSKQIYDQASEKNFAVLSVSNEIPFDFYFSKKSARSSHIIINQVFKKYNLPNENIFFIGVGLSGHRVMKHIEFMKEDNYGFQLNIQGIVVCNAVLDWASEWYKFDREKRNQRNNLWEPTFATYMLETHLNGTPKNNPDGYYDFSAYSYFDEKNENIKFYTSYAVRAYIEPAIKYWLKKHLKTMYDNNSPDMVGLLAELELAGNEKTELIVLQPEDNESQKKNPDSTWDAINKNELIDWINNQSE